MTIAAAARPAPQGNSPFDAIRHVHPDGTEYWYARELMVKLGYDQWRSMHLAVGRAQASCQNMGFNVAEHFTSITSIFAAERKNSNSAGRKGLDFILSRYACYLTAMNGDPNRGEIAAAQAYFYVKTRQAEAGQGVGSADWKGMFTELREVLAGLTSAAVQAKQDNKEAYNVGVAANNLTVDLLGEVRELADNMDEVQRTLARIAAGAPQPSHAGVKHTGAHWGLVDTGEDPPTIKLPPRSPRKATVRKVNKYVHLMYELYKVHVEQKDIYHDLHDRYQDITGINFRKLAEQSGADSILAEVEAQGHAEPFWQMTRAILEADLAAMEGRTHVERQADLSSGNR